MRNVSKRVIALARATAAATITWSALASAATPEVPAEKTRLENGLELLVHEDHRTPIVTVNVWYHVGSKDEPAGKNGFAHLFEHLMFQGSKHVPEDAYFRILERAGASDINGTTNSDRTNYFETLPPNQLELALWLESDRMGFLLDHVDQLTFQGQRDVVKNERRQRYENTPYGMVGAFAREALFPPSHPYHTTTIGTPKDLDAASLDDVRAFFRKWYVPSNATLVVAGDIDKAKTKALVEKYFGPLRGAPAPQRKPPPEVTLAKQTRLDVSAAVELGRLQISWPTPAFFTAADAALDMAAHVLSSGKTSRLYKRLVYDLQIAQDVSANQGSMELASSFQISATAAPGHTADELLKVIDEELMKLGSAPPVDAELARAKTAVRAQAVFELERDASRADMLNRYNHYTGDPGYLAKDLDAHERVTAAQVKDAVVKYLPLERRVVTVVTPNKAAPVCGRLDKVSP